MNHLWNTFLNWTRIRQQPDPVSLTSTEESIESWIGRICRASTPLRLTGYVEYKGRRMEAESIEAVIAKGRYVEVVGVIFRNRLVVKALPDRQVHRWLNLIKS